MSWLRGKSPWVLLVIFSVFLLLIQILFSIPAPVKWLEAVWEAGDLISFVGTITLGIIAIMQTEHESKINERLMVLEENRYKLEIRPFVMLEDWSVSLKTSSEIYYTNGKEKVFVRVAKDNSIEQFCFAIQLINTTQSYISVRYKGICYAESGDAVVGWSHSYTNNVNTKLRLAPEHSGEFIFWGNQKGVLDPIKEQKVRFSFIMENRFGERYQEDIDAVMLIMNNPQSGKMPYVSIGTTNYKIGRFVPTKDGKSTLVEEDAINGQT